MRSFAVLISVLFFLHGSESFVIQPRLWDYKGHPVGYEEARQATERSDEYRQHNQLEPILLLNGFGVGSFHQHRLMPELLKEDNRVVYGMDYLGQGRSWPHACDDGNSENERGLIYSADTWLDQIVTFMEEVILPEHQIDGANCKVHIVGNSVGGHLAAYVAASRPDLVASLSLLNATPVWGLNLPGWSGHLPPPSLPRFIGRYLFDQIRDLQTIEKYLESAYANRGAFGEELMNQIRACTEGRGGHAAFASILWSPPVMTLEGTSDFYECLSRLECDTLLLFGRDDPWCTPAFAKQMLAALSKRQSGKAHRYVELENVGHCPNHEAPQAVAQVLKRWVAAENRNAGDLSLLKDKQETFFEPWGETTLRERRENDIQLSLVDQLATRFV